MKVHQERSFQSLEQSPQGLIQTITDALRDGHDQFEATVEQHAVAIENSVTREHSRTRALTVEEAATSRQLMNSNHQEALHHEVEQHLETMEVVVQSSAQQTSTVKASQFTSQSIRTISCTTGR